MERDKAYDQEALYEGVHKDIIALNQLPQHGFHEIAYQVTTRLVAEEKF